MINGPALLAAIVVALTLYLAPPVLHAAKAGAQKVKHGVVHVVTLGHK